MTLFLIVAGTTGSIITFEHEFDAALNPGLYYASRGDGQAPLDPLTLRERLQTQLPAGVRAWYVPLQHEPGHAQIFYVTLPEDQQDTGDNEYFVDPYNGKVLGSRLRGDLTQGLKNVLPFIYRLHYSLALERVGTVIMGVVALLWTFDCFVGAYLTLPVSAGQTRAKKPDKSWLRRWKPAWLVRATPLFALIFTWHRASGLWIWGMLLVFAWSAVGLNLSEVYTPVMRAAFDMPKRGAERIPTLAQPRLEPKLSWQQAHAAAKALLAERADLQRFAIVNERRLMYDAARGTYRYQVRSSLDVSDRYSSTTLWIDGDSARFVALELPVGENAGSTLTTWIDSLHFGAVALGGMAYRLFVCVCGIAISVLSFTGAWIWWKKSRKRAAH
ncbi:MAG: hypothetical protein RL701_3118 [Pseudomonadota bacterium]|jgi:uncharacterized iron-regulated membrane protein